MGYLIGWIHIVIILNCRNTIRGRSRGVGGRGSDRMGRGVAHYYIPYCIKALNTLNISVCILYSLDEHYGLIRSKFNNKFLVVNMSGVYKYIVIFFSRGLHVCMLARTLIPFFGVRGRLVLFFSLLCPRKENFFLVL